MSGSDLPSRRALFALAALLCGGLVGCGGNGGRAAGLGIDRTQASGAAHLSIAWPTGTRLIPTAANSVTVSFLNGSTVVASQTVARPFGGGLTNVSFPNLPTGTLTLKAQAFPNSDGTGTAQAGSSQSVTIVGGATTPFSLTMASTIASLAVTPATKTIGTGATTTLTATPKDASNATVLVSSTITWSSSNPSVATVDSSGVVTGVASGTATITATETESGQTGTATVSVLYGSSGSLRANAIYFGHWGDPSEVSSVLPEGTGRQDGGGNGGSVVAAFPDPDHAGQMIFAAEVSGAYGVYRGTTFDPSTSTVLASPTYDSISTIEPTAGGDVLMVATAGGTSYAYLLSSGSVTQIDQADTASISLDGTHVAYSKIVGSYDNLYVWDRAHATSSLLVANNDSIFPSFSRDGTSIVFSSDRDGQSAPAPWDLYRVATAGGSVTRLTNSPNVSEFGASYDETGTKLAYVGVSSDPTLTGVFVLANSTTLQVATDSDVSLGTYWTTSAGRSRTVLGGRFTRLALPKGLSGLR